MRKIMTLLVVFLMLTGCTKESTPEVNFDKINQNQVVVNKSFEDMYIRHEEKLEKERIEKERIKAEEERKEKERLEAEKKEKERLEKEQKEKERKEKEQANKNNSSSGSKNETPKQPGKTETPKTETPKQETPKPADPKPADPKPTEPEPEEPKGNGYYDAAGAKEMFNIINAERKSQGLPALKWNNNLTSGADVRSKELVSKFSHTRPNGKPWSTIHGDAHGENVAFGYQSAVSAMAGFMGSPGHRDNILLPDFQSVAVSAYVHEGIYYWTQLFSYR